MKSLALVFAMLCTVACSSKSSAPSPAPSGSAPSGSAPAPAAASGSGPVAAGGNDLKARCERFVTKAEALGIGEKESTHAQKVELCVSEAPPAAFMDCFDKAATKEAAEACK